LKPRLNEQQGHEAAELYTQGLGTPEIARRFNVSITAVNNALKRENIVKRMHVEASNPRFVGAESAKIVQEYESGISINQLALIHAASPETIHRTLRREKVSVRPSGGIRKHIINDDMFDVIDTEEKAYWLGFIASDGSVGSAKDYVSIVLASKDIEHLRKFCRWIADDMEPYSYAYGSERSMVNIFSQQIVKSLSTYGIVPRKTYTFNHIPDISSDLKKHFIRGYVDGDGGLYINAAGRFSFQISAYNRGILEEIQEHFIKEIGISRSSIYKTTIWMYQKGGRKEVLQIVEYLYKDSTISLDRKYAVAMEMIERSNQKLALQHKV